METEKSLRQSLRELEVGGVLTVPLERSDYVRNACSSLGLQMGRRYTTSVCRQNRTVTVTRLN